MMRCVRCVLLLGLSRTLAVRTISGDLAAQPCNVIDTLRISYYEPFNGPIGLTGTLHSGEFDLIHSSAWNGVTFATKYYGELGFCAVDYSVSCAGTAVTLQLKDSCNQRSDNRSLSKWYDRTTELHQEKSWLHPFQEGNDVWMKVYLADRRSIRMKSDGSRVDFRLVRPPTLEEQLADPSKIRFFARVPKVASCLPDDRDDIFKSTTHNSSYSAQQCAACYNLLESKVKGTALCDGATTSAGDLRCKVLAHAMSKDGVLDLVVNSILESWRRSQEKTTSLAWELGCQDLGCCPLDPTVSKVLMEEADRLFTVEQFAEKQRLMHSDVQSVPVGIVEKVLQSSARVKLESVLKTKDYNNDKGFAQEDLKEDDLKKLKVATTNAECRWSFRQSRCTPQGSCAYRFRAGDLNLHQSCRVKAKGFRPTRDEECEWNWGQARCKHPKYCARRCNGDWNLDKCCKLRKVPLTPPEETKQVSGDKIPPEMIDSVLKDLQDIDWDEIDGGDEVGLEADEDSGVKPVSSYVDDDIGLEADEEITPEMNTPSSEKEPEYDAADAGEGEEEGNCGSDSDRKLLLQPGFSKKLEKDVRGSLTWKLSLDREKCHKKHIKLGLSAMCASCFVDVEDCSMQHCFKLMAGAGPKDPKTKQCMEESEGSRVGCYPALRKCAGLSDSELPQPD